MGGGQRNARYEGLLRVYRNRRQRWIAHTPHVHRHRRALSCDVGIFQFCAIAQHLCLPHRVGVTEFNGAVQRVQGALRNG